MGIPANVDPPKAQERADDFLQAAQAILKQEPNALASADKPTSSPGTSLCRRNDRSPLRFCEVYLSSVTRYRLGHRSRREGPAVHLRSMRVDFFLSP